MAKFLRGLSRRYVGLFLGPAVFILVLMLAPPGAMPLEAWRVSAVAALMATWWVTEAIPIPATALLPLVLLPMLQIAPVAEAAAPYSNPLIFLFLGGFLIALAMQRWDLHQRIALTVLHVVGTRPDFLIAGFMLTTALLSMWVSNTATAAMMLPIGLSVISLLRTGVKPDATVAENIPVALLLGIAFAANIGGMGTLVGTPPNALLAGFMADTYAVEIGFAQWMAVAIPVVAVLLLLAWVVLTKLIYPVGSDHIAGVGALLARKQDELGPMTKAERRVGAVFLLTGLCWIFRPILDDWFPQLSLSDPGIAVTGALALFLIPVDLRRNVFLLDWEATKDLPWSVLILVGGGLSLGTAVEASGLSAWVAETLSGMALWPLWSLVAMVALIVMLISHITSNTATAAAFVPLLASLALTLDQDPLLLTIPAVMAASCAFMLPVATPPNAIIFASGMISVPQMVRAGIMLSFAAILLIMLATYTVVALVFDIEHAILPDWAMMAGWLAR